MDLTYLAVDKMRKDKSGSGGCVVNISSGAGNFVDCFWFHSEQNFKYSFILIAICAWAFGIWGNGHLVFG